MTDITYLIEYRISRMWHASLATPQRHATEAEARAHIARLPQATQQGHTRTYRVIRRTEIREVVE